MPSPPKKIDDGGATAMGRNKGSTEVGSRRRAKILGGVESLVESTGFDHLTMESIAGSIGIARSSLYHYVPQKVDMHVAPHEQTMGAQIGHLRAIATSSVPGCRSVSGSRSTISSS